MRSTPRFASLLVVVVALLLVACAAPANPSGSPTPSGTPNPSVTPGPSVTPPPSGDPSTPPPSVAPAPKPTPVPTPAPTPKPIGWSKFQAIADVDDCFGLTATIDARGRHHVAAVCGTEIRYYTSADGITWAGSTFPTPAERIDQLPQLAADGNTVYLAFSRLSPEEGGCGDPGLEDLGVFVRTRTLPSGDWTEPVRIGEAADNLQGYRVVGGVQHLTVKAAHGGVFYERVASGVTSRVALPNAVGTSLRVGDDGQARIAYTTGHTLRYARVAGTTLEVSTIAKVTDTSIQAPLLVLGAGNRPYVLFTEYRDTGEGCISVEPGPQDGTYFAWATSGGWTTERFSKVVGITSFTVDGAGRAHAIVTGDGNLRYFTSRGDGWTGSRIAGRNGIGDPVIRTDPTSGRLVLFGIDFDDGIGLISKPLA